MMDAVMSEKRPRLTLDVSKDVRDQLERLKRLVDCGSITEVIRRSLVLYEECVTSRKLGTTIIFRSHDGKETKLLPL